MRLIYVSPYTYYILSDFFYTCFLVIPVDDISKSDYITMVLTERGGHVAFIDTLFAQGPCYMDRMFSQYVDAVFTNTPLLESVINNNEQSDEETVRSEKSSLVHS